MIHRLLNISNSYSFFLFGARGTGKTTFLNECFKNENILFMSLLDLELEDRLLRNPNELSEIILYEKKNKNIEWVVIDEIQKIPKLLDTVHLLIEKEKIKFALTGSSSRKLKRGASNLLAGRAIVNNLYTFTHRELGERFDLQEALEFGLLPQIIHLNTKDEKRAFLKSYSLTYLQEEIKAEQIVRNLDPFRKFLEVSAQTNCKILNYSKIARDVGVDVKTVQSYYQILEDTLLGFILEPYHRSIRKRQTQGPKFYYFDMGVKRALDRTLTVDLLPQTSAYGEAFEHFVFTEIIKLNSYANKDFSFSYLRTKDDVEIDLIIERPGRPIALVEIKSSTQIKAEHVNSLVKIAKDFENAECFCLSLDKTNKTINGVECLYFIDGIKALGL